MSDPKHTAFAMQALGFADLFNIKVGDFKVNGHRVELSAPEGPSTGGGKQSVQHVKLVGEGGVVLSVAGSADQIEKNAEIRTYEYLAELHAQRFKGAKIPIDRVQYLALVARMKAFFAEQGLHVVMIEPPRSITAPTARVPKVGMSPGAIIGIFVAVAAVIAGAMFFVLRSKHGG
jgi:hypothetical protein